MIEYQKISITINFNDGVMEDRLARSSVLHELENNLLTYFIGKNIKSTEVNITMSTEEKIRAEVIHEDGLFRIVKTRQCHALLQVRKEERNGSFIWQDLAWFSCGSEDECKLKALNEIQRLTKKHSKIKGKLPIPRGRKEVVKKVYTTEQIELLKQLIPKE